MPRSRWMTSARNGSHRDQCRRLVTAPPTRSGCRTNRHDTLGLFRSTIERAGLEDTVVAVVGTSQLVGAHWGAPLGFCFIDACHDAPVLEDHMLWAPHVMSGGFLLFHDSAIPVIAEAIARAKSDGFEPVGIVESLTILRRP